MEKGILIGTFVGQEVLVRDIAGYHDTIKQRLKEAVGQFATEATAQAKANIHSRTGKLAASVRWTGVATDKRILAQIGTDEFVGRILESGWTPNPHTGKKGTDWGKGWGKGWKRNPKKNKNARWTWNHYLAKKGSRTIFAYPFLKPYIWDNATRIRDRLTAITRGEA